MPASKRMAELLNLLDKYPHAQLIGIVDSPKWVDISNVIRELYTALQQSEDRVKILESILNSTREPKLRELTITYNGKPRTYRVNRATLQIKVLNNDWLDVDVMPVAFRAEISELFANPHENTQTTTQVVEDVIYDVRHNQCELTETYVKRIEQAILNQHIP